VIADQSGPADIAAVRRYRSRSGLSMNLEQEIIDDLGIFGRAGFASGNVEPDSYTDIDRTVAAGLSLTGKRWRHSIFATGTTRQSCAVTQPSQYGILSHQCSGRPQHNAAPLHKYMGLHKDEVIVSDIALPGSIEPAADKGPDLGGVINPLTGILFGGVVAAVLLFVAYSIYSDIDAAGTKDHKLRALSSFVRGAAHCSRLRVRQRLS
jgi:Carbohydrate-selective porin, OprB family